MAAVVVSFAAAALIFFDVVALRNIIDVAVAFVPAVIAIVNTDYCWCYHGVVVAVVIITAAVTAVAAAIFVVIIVVIAVVAAAVGVI